LPAAIPHLKFQYINTPLQVGAQAALQAACTPRTRRTGFHLLAQL
jgi:hypothetical protein